MCYNDNMKKITLILTVLVSLALVSTTQAAPPPEGWGAHQIRLAEQWWGGQRPANCTSLSIEFDATVMTNAGAAGEATEPERPEPCIMRVAHITYIPLMCQVVIHEYGHLLGHGHSPDPHSIMYGDPWSTESGAAPWEPEHIGICYWGNGKKLAR